MRGRPQQIREDDLLDAARDVFAEEGHGATTARIAARAKVSEGILYYRYKTKEALLAAVIERETEPPAEVAGLAKAAAERSLEANLERLVAALLESVEKGHRFLLLAETSPSSHLVRQALFARKAKPAPQRLVEDVARYFEAEARLGRARKLNGLAAARAAFGACVDFVRSRIVGGAEDDRAEFERGLVDLLLHGIAKPQPRKP